MHSTINLGNQILLIRFGIRPPNLKTPCLIDNFMQNLFSRTEMLLGKEAMDKLAACRVAVFGAGGVGGYVIEALARSGIGTIDIIDNDTVCPSNINRQIIATTKTIGLYKVDAAENRVKDINPDIIVHTYKTFFMPETSSDFDFNLYDYVVDAIDTVTGKIELIVKANETCTPIISSMGAGNKLDPTAFEVTDIYKTSVCPLAKVMRRELKQRGIKKLKVVYSKEMPLTPLPEDITADASSDTEPVFTAKRRQTPGSVAFVPSVVGLIIAGEVIKDLSL